MDSVQQLSRTPGFSAMLKDIDMSNTVRQLWEKVSMDSTLLDSCSQHQRAAGCRLRQAAALLMFMCTVVLAYVHPTEVPCSTRASDVHGNNAPNAVTLSSSRPALCQCIKSHKITTQVTAGLHVPDCHPATWCRAHNLMACPLLAMLTAASVAGSSNEIQDRHQIGPNLKPSGGGATPAI